MRILSGHRRTASTGLVLAVMGAGVLVASTAGGATAAASGSCTDTARWQETVSARVIRDSCRTPIRVFADCSVFSDPSPNVDRPGQTTAVRNFDAWAAGCEQNGAEPFVSLEFEERGSWHEIAKTMAGGNAQNGTYTRSWRART